MTPRVPRGERIYAIGDIHGRADLLAELLADIRHDNDTRPAALVRIVLLGDIVDRGPDSAALVARCRELTGRHDRCIILKGNHEAMMVDALQGSFPALAFWMDHGGDAALASWGIPTGLALQGPSRELMDAARARVSSETIAWMDRLPLSHRQGNCLFVHAGIRPGVRFGRQEPNDLLWIRGDFTEHTGRLPYIVVHGHTIDEAGPSLRHGRLGIDTGAYRTGRLTAVGIEGGDFWSLSTGMRPVTLGKRPSIDDSVAGILGPAGERTTSPPRSVLRTRMLATASAAAAALLVAGTIAVVRGRSDGPGLITVPIAGTAPHLPESKTAPRDAAIIDAPAAPIARRTEEKRVAASEVAANRGIIVPPSTDLATPVRHDYAPAPRAILATERRAVSRRPTGDLDAVIARAVADQSPSPTTVTPPTRAGGVVPTGVDAVRPLDRATLPAILVTAASPKPRPGRLPESRKERVEAVDAIRLLRGK